MKKIDELMKDLGFNKQSMPSTKAAFVKNLIQQAYNVEVQVPALYQPTKESATSVDSLYEQLSLFTPTSVHISK